jgi:hypothetical protein
MWNNFVLSGLPNIAFVLYLIDIYCMPEYPMWTLR